MKKGTYEIRTKDGMKPQEGWLINEWFACHKKYRDWTLTHIPTGMNVGGNFRRRSDAAKMAEFLTANADWSFTDPAAMDETHTIAGHSAKSEMRFDVSHNRYEWMEA